MITPVSMLQVRLEECRAAAHERGRGLAAVEGPAARGGEPPPGGRSRERVRVGRPARLGRSSVAWEAAAAQAMVGLGFGQALEDRHLLGVGAVASAGHLEDEWELRESRLMEDGAKALLADLSLADVGVTVAVGAEAGHRVVAVDDLDPLQADDLIQLVQRP